MAMRPVRGRLEAEDPVRQYRKFPSRYGLNRPRTPGWIGYTVALRVGIVLVIAWAIFR